MSIYTTIRQLGKPSLKALALCGTFILAPVQLAFANEVVNKDAGEVSAVVETVYNYFEGINTKQESLIEHAFDKSAQLKYVSNSNDEVKVELIADAIKRWMGNDAQQRTGKVLSVNVAGDIAHVVFDFDNAFIDYLTLANMNGQWQIIDKVYVDK
ncbi:nuclear transport factor 2 family protein [Vibrio parahaemolyticus]|uniref:nuclear transport factor 2 family protein n=1 Tax=Vibrio mediterranei TaxID=689 RepID=UPI00406984E1